MSFHQGAVADEETAAPEPRRSSGAPARPRGSPCPQQPPRRGERMGPGAQIVPWTTTSSSKASPRRVFTRLNCSLIMRGLGRSTWEVWGLLEEKKTKTPKQKRQQEKPPRHHPPGLPAWEPLGFFSPPATKKLQVQREVVARRGGLRVRNSRAGMSCWGSLHSPGTCLFLGEEAERSGLPP